MSKKAVEKKFLDAQESLVIQQSDFSLSLIKDMAEKGSINLAPSYQRRDRWGDEKQSRLIESFIMNVPVPPVYLSEDEFGRYSVIDGKQRITAIKRFISGDFKLAGLETIKELNGLSFDDLPSAVQNALSIRPYIRAITLLRQSDPELKFEVFLRLNTWGERLNPQEIRNVAYSGKFNDLLFFLSENDVLVEGLKTHVKSSSAYKNMDDIEHVLRFFTLKNNWEKMSGSLSKEMDEFMKENRNPDSKRLQEMESDFNESIKVCKDIWEDKVFLKPLGGGQWRSQLISPLYDAEMVAVSMLTRDERESAIKNKAQAVKGVEELYKESSFVKSVSQATNTPSSIVTRINSMYKMLKAIA
ncbi:Protein of unknown function DUF262 [Onishia taeanensis]|uniref:GmrSD restriction endonucleases N-terminal domain-containing protein n=1 Tax=Onishia taeanensis TaxID=284577 RepID=A0A1G7RMC6_9GAMM|nr:DUF262 domain-containing protein [Halomonas taeanensis]SDG11835.1 Protein of unknown function DUF262 [Halomonas taeanensis]